MLVLKRKLGEVIWINDNISITITELDRGTVRIGITAPRAIPVYREELLTPELLATFKENAK